MEQTRLLIAIGVSFLIFFLWSLFFAPTPPEVPPEATKEESQSAPAQGTAKEPVAPQTASPGAPTQTAPQTAPTMPTQELQPTRDARTITVDTPLYTMTLSEKGGTVVSMVLKSYRETIEPDSPLKELINKNTKGGSIFLDLSGQTGINLEN